MVNFGQKKPDRYFIDIRWDIVKLVNKGENKILEIGCGIGNTGATLKSEEKANFVVGIERNKDIASRAVSEIDQVICADIERLNLKNTFKENSFDYIILADILEHLYNPWGLIKELEKYLKNEGFFIASLPNVRFWKVIKALFINKSWKYESDGVLDNTHLRFFAKKNIKELFDLQNLSIQFVIPKFKLKPKSPYKILNLLTLFLIQDLITRQYIIKVKKGKF